MSAYWENTLEQMYGNYIKVCKQINKKIQSLESIKKTISVVEWKLHELKKDSKGSDKDMVGI